MLKWRLSIHQGVVLIQFEPGTVVTPEMLKDIYHELNSDPEKYRTTNIVWDLRNIVPSQSLGFEEMLQIVRHIQASWDDQWKHEKSALLVNSKALFGLSRIYASLVEDKLGYEVNVFEDGLQAAIDWAKPVG